MLIIVSGPDRAGKSTLIEKCRTDWSDWPHDSIDYVHFGPVPDTYSDVLSYHKGPVLRWLESDKSICFLDRSYVCLHLLGSLRHQHSDHYDLMIDYELWLQSLQIDVVHVGLIPPWNAVAQRHIVELNHDNPTSASWRIRNQYIARQKEHSKYNERLIDFYKKITMFPSVAYTNPACIDPADLYSVCNDLI